MSGNQPKYRSKFNKIESGYFDNNGDQMVSLNINQSKAIINYNTLKKI